MYRNDKILSFIVTFGKKIPIEIVEKWDYFDKSIFNTSENDSLEDLNSSIYHFFLKRLMPRDRKDFQKILDGTGCHSGMELLFKGHGLSLIDHYWFQKEDENLRYEDINFFTNKWDDSFARAILNGDYESLKNVSLDVPDINTRGWAVKGWLCEETPVLYKIGIDDSHPEESISEVLASRLANRLFGKDEATLYELKMINGRYAAASKLMINIDEELTSLQNVLPYELFTLYSKRSIDKSVHKEFLKRIEEFGIKGLYEYFIKIACLRSLCFVNDLHFGNISIIKNTRTNEIRLAPIYDLAGSFGSSERGKQFLSNLNKGSLILIYYIYGSLEPDWDYSWYDPDKLIGFEDEIREYLSKSDFYTPELINNIISVYKEQKATLDALKQKTK